MSKLGLTLVAITALSVAVATQAYNIQAADAQAKLPNNSVRSETIVDGQVKTADLANNAVTTGKIADGTIQLNMHEVAGDIKDFGPGEVAFAQATCPDGEIRTGGGFTINGDLIFNKNGPTGDNSWEVIGKNRDPTFGGSLRATIMCLDATIP